MKDWQVWHEHYDDPASSLSRRLAVIQDLLRPMVVELRPENRIVSLCAGDGRDVLPVVGSMPVESRPQLVLVELLPPLASAAQQRAALLGVDATVLTADAGLTATWLAHVPVDLLLLCGIFGNISDEDVQRTIEAVPAMLTPGGTVVWTRGAFADRDLRPQVRRWFAEAGLGEIAFESERAGYGVGVHRMTRATATTRLPAALFTFAQGDTAQG